MKGRAFAHPTERDRRVGKIACEVSESWHGV